MNREKLTIGSVLFLAIGIVWITSYWNGTVGFTAGAPVSAVTMSMNVTVTGWPALGGILLTLVGVVMLLCSGVIAVMSIATAKRG